MARAVITLVALSAVATLLLAYADRLTRDARQRNQAAHAARIIGDVLPAGPYDDVPGLESAVLIDPGEAGDGELEYWPARRGGEVVAVAIAVRAPDGYVAPIDLLVGIDRAGKVTGVRPARHRETPGLGDAIEPARSSWILGFNSRGLDDPQPSGWLLRKDGGAFDQISGATVTSRAVTAAVRRALEMHEANRAVIYGTGRD